MTKEKSITERMQDVTRSLMEAGLIDKKSVAERYQKLEREKAGLEPTPTVDIKKSQEETLKALAAARAALKKINK